MHNTTRSNKLMREIHSVVCMQKVAQILKFSFVLFNIFTSKISGKDTPNITHPVLIDDINDHTKSTFVWTSIDQGNPSNLNKTCVNLIKPKTKFRKGKLLLCGEKEQQNPLIFPRGPTILDSAREEDFSDVPGCGECAETCGYVMAGNWGGGRGKK